MTGPVLVQRPRRKVHLAARQGDLWLSLCDRVALPLEGTTVTELQDALGTIDDHAGAVCQDCHRLILMSAYVGRDRIARLVASLELVA